MANFETGPVAHTALLGVDHRTFRTRTLGAPFPAAPGLNALNPNYDMNIAFPPAGQAEAGLALDRDADEIAVARLALLAGGDRDLAPLRLLLDGEQAPAVAPSANCRW